MASEKMGVNGRRKASTKKIIDMNFILTGITFDSFIGNFRFYSKMINEQGLELKIEKLKSPHQWQINVTDVSQHGPSGLPKEAVFSVMKNCLESMVGITDESRLVGKISDGIIDVEAGDSGQIYFYLDIPLAGILISYVFEMIPVAREPIDIMESLLHDAQDEIAELKNRIVQLETTRTDGIPVLISLRSSIPSINRITWNELKRNTSEDYFELSADQTSITIKKQGVYQISVRITEPTSNSARITSVYINGTAVAQACCGHNTGYLNSVTINDVFFLDGNTIVQILNEGQNNTVDNSLLNSLTIIKL